MRVHDGLEGWELERANGRGAEGARLRGCQVREPGGGHALGDGGEVAEEAVAVLANGGGVVAEIADVPIAPSAHDAPDLSGLVVMIRVPARLVVRIVAATTSASLSLR